MDASTLEYLAQTGREKHSLKVTKEYLQKVGLFRINPEDNDYEDDVVYDEIIEIYLPDIVVTISGKIFFPFWLFFGTFWRFLTEIDVSIWTIMTKKMMLPEKQDTFNKMEEILCTDLAAQTNFESFDPLQYNDYVNSEDYLMVWKYFSRS